MNQPLTQLQYEHVRRIEAEDAAARAALRAIDGAARFRVVSDGRTTQMLVQARDPRGLTSEQQQLVTTHSSKIEGYLLGNPDEYAAHAGEPLPDFGERARLPSIGGKPLVEMTDNELITISNRNRPA